MEEEGLRRYQRVVQSLLHYNMICLNRIRSIGKCLFENIAKELRIQAAQSTLEHVFYGQHGLFRC